MQLIRLMSLIVKLGRHGLIHGDFNEFNLMLLEFPAYDDGNFRVHCGDGENEDDGNEGNAQYVEIPCNYTLFQDDSDSQSSQSVISEEDDDIDEDELSHAAVYQKNKDQKIHGNVHRIRTGAESVVSTKSTIPPEEIKRRVALEKLRNKEKIKLRVKGKQSAVRRGRKENRQTLAEYAGWI
uniref:Non-specific serine/threonine protein kinase n=1 Tax=Heterorhabditis bacteriophora TaxID=37862 RepID=A0A1I7XNR6_HETBA